MATGGAAQSGADALPRLTAFDRFGERFLALADEPADEAQDRKARFFQIYLLIHVTARMSDWALPLRSGDAEFRLALLGVVAVATLLSLHRAWARTACAVAAGVLYVKLAYTFPRTSNHFFLELTFMTMLALFDLRKRDDRALFLMISRWMVAIFFFYTGFQKFSYGSYFDGQFLGIAVAREDRFATLFGTVLPVAEFARLTSLDTAPGSGPFSVDSPLFRAASNFVWIFELVAPFFLIWRPTRSFAALAAIGFDGALQAGAREFMFGSLFVNLLLLFPRRAWNRRLLPFFVFFYLFLMTGKLTGLYEYWN